MDARRQKRLGPAPIASFEKSFEDNTTMATTATTATVATIATAATATTATQQHRRITVSLVYA